MSVGDLYVLNVESIVYRYGEISHIENVMQTESRERVNRALVETRSSESTTTETSEKQLTELQTVEQYEMQQAIANASASSTSMSASLGVSAGYGPVSVDSQFGVSTTSSTSNSQSRASSFARSLTEKAVSEISSKVRQTRKSSTRTRQSEKNAHGFDNRLGNGHVVGIYRYLDKEVTSRLTNYGKRLMMEFIVPEPAAVLVESVVNAAPLGVTIEEPEPFVLQPSDIAASNYLGLAAQYGVGNLEAPPLANIKVDSNVIVEATNKYDYEESSGEDSSKDPDKTEAKYGFLSGALQVEVPDGYCASRIDCSCAFANLASSLPQPGEEEWIRFASANRSVLVTNYSTPAKTSDSIDISEELDVQGNVAIAWAGKSRRGFAASVTVLCRKHPSLDKQWQLTVWSAINDAYQSKKRAYDSQVAYALGSAARSFGSNAPVNRELERAELKRAALSQLSDQDFSYFGSLQFSDGALPETDLDEARAEGEYLRFFEEAIEWTNSVSVLYDYSWAGRHRWQELLSRTSSDADHQRFLRAGAAKLVVPVTPGYEVALLDYLDTGKLWDGQSTIELPKDHPLYDEVTEMIKEPRDLGTVDAGTQTDLIPTNLIILQLGPDPNQIAPVPPIVTPELPPAPPPA